MLETIDQCGAVLIQKRHESNRAFLRLSLGKRERPRADVLTAERLVAPFRGLDHFSVEGLEIVLDSAKRRLCGALKRGIQRGNG